MGGELFKKLRANVEQVAQELPDTRQQKLNLRYPVVYFMNCAFAVFFFHHQPLLDFQRHMKERLGRNNLETVFGVREIPTDTQIRTILDQTEPEHLSPLFNATLKTTDEAGVLEGYRVLDGGVLIALEGSGTICRKPSTATGVYILRKRRYPRITTSRWQGDSKNR